MYKAALGPNPVVATIAGCAVLTVLEIVAVRSLIPLPDVWIAWPIIGVANFVVKTGLLAMAIFCLAAWPRRAELLGLRSTSSGDATIAALVCANLASFALLIFSRAQLAHAESASSVLPAYIYATLLLIAPATLFLAAAPYRFWRDLFPPWRHEMTIAMGVAFVGLALGELSLQNWWHFLSEDAWNELSGATLQLAYWMLSSFESHAVMEPTARILGARDFSVQVYAACSGYEGMALIAAFLTGYICIFRQSLRFPNVLLLLPVSMLAIWLLNAFRIALLVWIGANFSPEVALGGFHSQFGWICFLLVAMAIMTAAQTSAFFSNAVPARRRSEPNTVPNIATGPDEALIFLAPFIALMAAQIVIRSFSPLDQALYPLKIIFVASALALFWQSYTRMRSNPSAFSLLVGVAGGVLWIATDTGAGLATPLGSWLAALTPAALASWLVLRGIGTIFFVPIAEELAFRGYLYRVLISARFEDVDFRKFGWIALTVSSVLFGLMHDRWFAAAIAGAVYALLMVRSGRLSDAVAAHMATNAVVFAWAVAFGQWSLL